MLVFDAKLVKILRTTLFYGTIVGMVCDYVTYFVELYETKCIMDAIGTLFLNLLDYSG